MTALKAGCRLFGSGEVPGQGIEAPLLGNVLYVLSRSFGQAHVIGVEGFAEGPAVELLYLVAVGVYGEVVGVGLVFLREVFAHQGVDRVDVFLAQGLLAEESVEMHFGRAGVADVEMAYAGCVPPLGPFAEIVAYGVGRRLKKLLDGLR